MNLDNDVNSQYYIPRNLICVITEYPVFFSYKEPKERDELKEVLRTILEVKADKITGFNDTLLFDGTHVVHSALEPTFHFRELFGRSIQNFLSFWITTGVKFGPEMMKFSAMFIEPDPTHKLVMKAWHCRHMYPRMNGHIQSSRNMLEPHKPVLFDVPFGYVWDPTPSAMAIENAFAQELLNKANNLQ